MIVRQMGLLYCFLCPTVLSFKGWSQKIPSRMRENVFHWGGWSSGRRERTFSGQWGWQKGTSGAQQTAAQHGHGRLLAGANKEPGPRGDGRIGFSPETLLELCRVCCSQKTAELCVETGQRRSPPAKARQVTRNFLIMCCMSLLQFSPFPKI